MIHDSGGHHPFLNGNYGSAHGYLNMKSTLKGAIERFQLLPRLSLGRCVWGELFASDMCMTDGNTAVLVRRSPCLTNTQCSQPTIPVCDYLSESLPFLLPMSHSLG